MPHVHDVGVAAGATRGAHKVLLDLDHGLGVLAFLAEDELLDEAIQHVLELALVMAAIDDVALSLNYDFKEVSFTSWSKYMVSSRSISSIEHQKNIFYF